MNYLKNNKNLLFHLILLCAIFGVFFLANFPFGLWFSGWDNLHPEFNFLLNFKRGIFAVWQENQGLGTYGGHGYAATLPHTLVLYLMSFILPLSALRSFFTFLMLFLGIIGVFFMTADVAPTKNEDMRNKAGLFAGLFYLVNMGTLQNFFVMLEAFIIHFATLPWLFLTLTRYLRYPTRKNLFFFFVVNVLASAQGFIPPLFFVYMLLLTMYLGIYILYKRNGAVFKKVVFVFVATLIINAYWLLPVVYYSVNNSQTYLQAYNNLSSTDDFILKNKAYGTVKNVALIKGFISEVTDTTEVASNTPIFSEWHKHFNNPAVTTMGLGFFAIALVGMLHSLLEKNKWKTCAFAVGFIITFALLATNTFPFSYVTVLFQKIPLFRQAFRISFTKFSISFSFFYAVMFGIGIAAILKGSCRSLVPISAPRQKRDARFLGPLPVAPPSLIIFLKKVSLLMILVSLLYFALPSFTGNFLYKHATLKIPTAYTDLFSYLKKQNTKGRIANMPQGWNWGWSVYKWGYSGSGFLWYGIEQPIMDRSFDVWGSQNENYYWEVRYAIFSKKYDLFDTIVKKYNINWVLFDKNLIPYPSAKGFLYADEFEKYLTNSNNYVLDKTFDNKKDGVQPLLLYKVKNERPVDQREMINLTDVKNVGPAYSFSNYDAAYAEQGTYITNSALPFDVYYPFRSLFSARPLQNNPYTIDISLFDLVVSAHVPKDILEKGSVQAPIGAADQNIVVTKLVENETIYATIPLVDAPFIYNNRNDSDFYNRKPAPCDKPTGTFDQKIIDKKYLRFTAKRGATCYDIILPSVEQKNAYVVQIKSKHSTGSSLRFAVVNGNSKKSDIEVDLPLSKDFTTSYFVLPPMQSNGLGYNLHFDNRSITTSETSNDIEEIVVRSFPYNFLTHLNFVMPDSTNDNGRLFVDYHAFNTGWKAYAVGGSKAPPRGQGSAQRVEAGSWKRMFPFLFGKELKDHVLVNNWANGWEIGENMEAGSLKLENVVLIFWPQYLEWIGFGLLFISIVLLFHGSIARKKTIEQSNN